MVKAAVPLELPPIVARRFGSRLSLTPGAAIARQSVPYLGADACQIEQSFSKGEIDRLRGQLGRLS